MKVTSSLFLAAVLFSINCSDDDGGADAATTDDAATNDAAINDAPSGADAMSLRDADPNAVFVVSGSIVGQVPDNSVAVVIWSVTAGVDSTHKFGEGVASGGNFFVEFPAVPPNSALNLDELGVGLVIFFPAGKVIADGQIIDNTVFDDALGGSADHSIIFRHSNTVGIPWEGSFPTESFSCGECVRMQQGFDEFQLIECANFSGTQDDLGNLDFCNWT